MRKRQIIRFISILFMLIFCFSGIQADFHQPYAFLPCISPKAAAESVSAHPGYDSSTEDSVNINTSARYLAERFSLPDYSLLSDGREAFVYYQGKNRENGRSSLSKAAGISLGGSKYSCTCFLSIAASCHVSNLRTNSEKITVAYVHNKDGKKS